MEIYKPSVIKVSRPILVIGNGNKVEYSSVQWIDINVHFLLENLDCVPTSKAITAVLSRLDNLLPNRASFYFCITGTRFAACDPPWKLKKSLSTPAVKEKIGALEGFGKIPAILGYLQTDGWQRDQMSSMAWSVTSDEDWNLQQKLDAQIEIPGACLEAHPHELVLEKIGRHMIVADAYRISRCSRTAKEYPMFLLTIAYHQGTLDVILFPDV